MPFAALSLLVTVMLFSMISCGARESLPDANNGSPVSQTIVSYEDATQPIPPPRFTATEDRNLDTVLPVETARIIVTQTPMVSIPHCEAESCFYSSAFLFTRPAGKEANDRVDTTYRFGSTQGGKRDPHHGVEFLNSAGTPVLAAGDGIVIVAGNDQENIYSPYPNFYGNLIVLEHLVPEPVRQQIPSSPEVVYSLYAHLSEILVKKGEKVISGQEIGWVGMSGAATGSHLHFEVRVGENTYDSARNPELWLIPETGSDGLPGGALAGRVLDSGGNHAALENIVIKYLPDEDDLQSGKEYYVSTYEGIDQPGKAPWGESFGIGDLPPGKYLVSFPLLGLQRHIVEIMPGQLTVVTFDAGY